MKSSGSRAFVATLIGVVLWLVVGAAWAQQTPTVEEVTKQLRAHYYDLKAVGVQDLVCTVTSPNIDDAVKQTMPNAGVNVFVKYLWKAPNTQQYRIVGLPDGPSALRKDLATLFNGQASYVMRKSIAQLISECECTIAMEGELYKVTGKIKDAAEGAGSFDAYIKPDGWVIDRIVMQMNGGETITTSYKTEEAQGVRFVTTESSKIEKDGQTTLSEVAYAYGQVDNVMAVRTAVAKVKNPDGKEMSLQFNFSNYQVNLGLPDSMFGITPKGDKPAPAG